MKNEHSSVVQATSAMLLAAALMLSMPAAAWFQNPPTRLVAPLTEAVWTGNYDQIRQLLDAGEDPTKEDDQAYTPWMWAILARDSQALSLLLERISTIP